jgi:hypothetical protein
MEPSCPIASMSDALLLPPAGHLLKGPVSFECVERRCRRSSQQEAVLDALTDID